MGLVFEWLIEQGGIVAMEERNIIKSNLVYNLVDGSKGFYW
jgi:phosphoserine aminotransferase